MSAFVVVVFWFKELWRAKATWPQPQMWLRSCIHIRHCMFICDVHYVCRVYFGDVMLALVLPMQHLFMSQNYRAIVSSCCENTTPFLGQRCVYLLIMYVYLLKQSSFSISEYILFNTTNKGIAVRALKINSLTVVWLCSLIFKHTTLSPATRKATE